jgi:hypothetical protein
MDIIEKSIAITSEAGLRIVRGPSFTIENDFITECSWIGALLFAHNRSMVPLQNGWFEDLCINILWKDSFWFWRYNYGFNQGRSLEFFTEDPVSKKRKYTEDTVSKEAARLSRSLGLFRNSKKLLSI